ncbi:MAG: sigma-70 family RNA polymerase sigma factor [Polyangiaceae bacterium]
MTAKSPADIAVLFRSAEHVVARVARETALEWPQLQYADLYSVGKVAAISKAETYDPARGPFAAFVFRHVAGAMHDYVRLERRERDEVIHGVRDEWRRGDPEEDSSQASADGWASIDETPEQATANAVQEHRLRAQRMAETALMVPHAPVDPEALYLEDEGGRVAVETMNAVLAGFSDVQRDAFRLHRIEGREQTEVAERLGISVATVRRHVDAVVEALRAGFEKAGIEVPRKRKAK